MYSSVASGTNLNKIFKILVLVLQAKKVMVCWLWIFMISEHFETFIVVSVNIPVQVQYKLPNKSSFILSSFFRVVRITGFWGAVLFSQAI